MDKALKSYQERLIAFFESTRKTSWGKNELISQIKDLYIEHLEYTVDTFEEGPKYIIKASDDLITVRNNSDQ